MLILLWIHYRRPSIGWCRAKCRIEDLFLLHNALRNTDPFFRITSNQYDEFHPQSHRHDVQRIQH